MFTQGREAYCGRRGPDRVELIKPNWVLRSRSLGLICLEDKPVIMSSVEFWVDLLQLGLVLLSGILH